MNDPKYTIRDGKVWHIEGNYPLPDDEPTILLRGKDPYTLVALEAYAASHPDDAHRAGALKRLAAIREYQQKYPERTRIGCHDCPKDGKYPTKS